MEATPWIIKGCLAPWFLLLMTHGLRHTDAFAASGEPVDVRADQVEYFDRIGKVVASGSVVATQEDVKLTCDQATIYMETKDAYLRGRVRLFQPGGLLKGEEIIYNFQTKKGTILQAESEAGPWRSIGEVADKVSETSVLHRDGYITSCDFDEPHTRLRAKEVRVFLDDRVILKKVVMFLGKMPVLYLPSYTHPLDDKRPRVTLIPGKNKQWGLFLLTAWRLYLHENLQGRIHVDYRERLDLASGVDLKYQLPLGGDGRVRTYYTNERAIQREHPWSKYFNSEDDQPTPERQRYKLQLNHRWQMDTWTLAGLNYHKITDRTVIKDYYPLEYLRDQSIPQASLNIVRSAPQYSLSLSLSKWVNRFQGMSLERPSMGFGIRPIRVPWLPVLGTPALSREESVGRTEEEILREQAKQKGIFTGSLWQYQSSFNFSKAISVERFSGKSGSFYGGSTSQQMSYSTRILRWLNFNPHITFQETTQSRGSVEDAPQFQQAVKVGFGMSSKFFRIFPITTNLMELHIHRLRHIVTPTLSYTYQAKPTIDSNRLRSSSGIVKENGLGPGIEHKLQTKRFQDGRWETFDLARFTNSFNYNLEGESGRGGRWGGIVLDLETSPYPWMSFEADASIDPHRFYGKPTHINFDFSLHPEIKRRPAGEREEPIQKKTELPLTEGLERLPWSFGLGWRYSRNSSSQLTTQARFNLGKKWWVGIYQGFDIKRFVTETNITGPRTVKKIYDVPEFEYRLIRDFHEWTAELVYGVQRQQGESILLLVRLKASPEMPLEYHKIYHQPKAGRNFPKY